MSDNHDDSEIVTGDDEVVTTIEVGTIGTRTDPLKRVDMTSGMV